MKLLFTFLLAGSFMFSGCKKGEDDPQITLRTRKARLSGEWRMSSGTASFTWPNYNELFTLDGTGYSNYWTDPYGMPYIITGRYTLSLVISKDGKITFNELSPFGPLQGEGSWAFNSGVGDEKKKESLTIKIETFSKGHNYSGFFNCGGTNMHYRLKELRNKKLVMFASGLYYTGNGIPVTYQREYTFEQNDAKH